MSRVRSRDTKPEMLVRRGLHARGFRFRLHRKDLPGCPDLVFPGCRSVIFVHGCFWHGHACAMFKMPATRPEFWSVKIAGNRMRDAHALEDLAKAGWRVLVVWECDLRGPGRRPLQTVIDEIVEWLNSDHASDKLSGKRPRGLKDIRGGKT